MKTFNYKRLFSRLAVLALMPACFAVVSCKEDIDESNLYTFKGETIEDFLANRSLPRRPSPQRHDRPRT